MQVYQRTGSKGTFWKFLFVLHLIWSESHRRQHIHGSFTGWKPSEPACLAGEHFGENNDSWPANFTLVASLIDQAESGIIGNQEARPLPPSTSVGISGPTTSCFFFFMVAAFVGHRCFWPRFWSHVINTIAVLILVLAVLVRAEHTCCTIPVFYWSWLLVSELKMHAVCVTAVFILFTADLREGVNVYSTICIYMKV